MVSLYSVDPTHPIFSNASSFDDMIEILEKATSKKIQDINEAKHRLSLSRKFMVQPFDCLTVEDSPKNMAIGAIVLLSKELFEQETTFSAAVMASHELSYHLDADGRTHLKNSARQSEASKQGEL